MQTTTTAPEPIINRLNALATSWQLSATHAYEDMDAPTATALETCIADLHAALADLGISAPTRHPVLTITPQPSELAAA